MFAKVLGNIPLFLVFQRTQFATDVWAIGVFRIQLMTTHGTIAVQ